MQLLLPAIFTYSLHQPGALPCFFLAVTSKSTPRSSTPICSPRFKILQMWLERACGQYYVFWYHDKQRQYKAVRSNASRCPGKKYKYGMAAFMWAVVKMFYMKKVKQRSQVGGVAGSLPQPKCGATALDAQLCYSCMTAQGSIMLSASSYNSAMLQNSHTPAAFRDTASTLAPEPPPVCI